MVGHLFQNDYLICSMNYLVCAMNYLVCSMNYLIYSINHLVFNDFSVLFCGLYLCELYILHW